MQSFIGLYDLGGTRHSLCTMLPVDHIMGGGHGSDMGGSVYGLTLKILLLYYIGNLDGGFH